jgi:hypothetical protein
MQTRLQTPFAILNVSLMDMARQERHHIQFCSYHAARGSMEPPPGVAFSGWAMRLKHLEELVELLEVLGQRETAVRALDPRLARALLCTSAPTMWPEAGPDGGESPLTGDTPAG